MGGPDIIGMENIPNKKPSACEAPLSPTRSKAIGPRKQIKRPSQSPMMSVITMRPTNELEKGMQRVVAPITKKANCCIRILKHSNKWDHQPSA